MVGCDYAVIAKDENKLTSSRQRKFLVHNYFSNENNSMVYTCIYIYIQASKAEPDLFNARIKPLIPSSLTLFG